MDFLVIFLVIFLLGLFSSPIGSYSSLRVMSLLLLLLMHFVSILIYSFEILFLLFSSYTNIIRSYL